MQTLLDSLPDALQREPLLYGLLALFLSLGALLGIWFLLALIGLARALITGAS